MKNSEENHALENAKAWLARIQDLIGRYDAAQANEDYEAAEDIQREIGEAPLSVEYRSEWAGLDETLVPGEYRILLSTGGPALQITGDLDDFLEASTAFLQYQDWGTLWTNYPLDSEEAEVVLSFAQQFFYFN